MKAAAPAKGQKIDPNSNDVKKYIAHLNGKHADAAAAVGAEKFYDYGYSYNGFAAKMSEQQAAKLATLSGVVDVSKDVLQQPTTSTTPTFLGLDEPVTGLWAKAGGPSKAGEDVIVGVVDTGIWPEHPSFSDRKDYVSGRRERPAEPCVRSAAGLVERLVPVRRAVLAGHVHEQADRCALLPERLRSLRHRQGRLHVSPRPRQPWQPHVQHGGR